MKAFIKVHASDTNDPSRIDLILVPTACIKCVTPVPGSGLTSINDDENGAYRVTETVEEIYNLIYPSPFITLNAANARDPRIVNPVSLRASAITGLTNPNLDLDQSKTAVDVGDGQYLVDETKAQIEELIRNAL